MYWNRDSYLVTRELWVLNSNIRCIEIYKNDIVGEDNDSWIVTLDVLKSKYLGNVAYNLWVE